jgi:hypothetical protein
MTLGERIAAVFQMDDEAWRRHANPWSVWTRNTVPPLLILAFWSRVWLGWWSVLAVTAALLWTWLNPRLFSPPDSMESWTSKGVLGERIWLNRKEVPVPEHHRSVPTLLSAISGIGVGIIIWGVANLKLWPTAFGTAVLYFGNLWHFDRMVWLYEDMKEATPEYESWQSQTSVESAP